MHSRLLAGFGAGLLAAGLLACASFSSAPRCRIEVTGLEEYDPRPGDVRIAYRVKGVAGAEGKVWLAAKTAEQTWISGDGLDVGPGSFAAIVDLRLTGRPARYKALLEVAGRRCDDDAPQPGG